MKPANEQELAEAIATAQSPLEIIGGGTRCIGQTSGTPLYTSGLSGVSLYEPGALTLVVKTGTALAEVEALLASENQRLPFEPSDLRALQASDGTPTIGGMVATNASGPRRIQAGGCRDSMIGVRFVDGQGHILKNGGRVMKNVTGYDLVKLMAGSHGTLGVISEVAFKVLPAPETAATVLIEGLDDTSAIATLARALGSPYDVNAAAHFPATGQTVVRVEGLEGSVTYRAAQLAKLLGGAVAEFDWNALRDLHPFAPRSGDVWRFSVKPSDGPRLGAALRENGAVDVLYDWAGGLVWALTPEGKDMRPAMGDIRGHATLIRASAATKAAIVTFQPEAPLIAKINAGLRAKFDPRGILNAGIMG